MSPSKLSLSLEKRFENASFSKRLLSALVLAPCALLFLYAGGLPYQFAVMALMAQGLREWISIVDDETSQKEYTYAAYAALEISLLCGLAGKAMGGLVLAFALGLILVLVGKRRAWNRALWVACGIFYLTAGGLGLMTVRAMPDWGMAFIFYLVFVVWGTDIGAFLAGRLFGGPKICPKISPSKTWAGLAGGALVASALGYGVMVLFGSQTPWIAVGMAILLACVAQLGDFFESFVKRRFGVKDSGTLIPGHGGLLDRIDGLLFAAAFFSLFLSLSLQDCGL